MMEQGEKMEATTLLSDLDVEEKNILSSKSCISKSCVDDDISTSSSFDLVATQPQAVVATNPAGSDDGCCFNYLLQNMSEPETNTSLSRSNRKSIASSSTSTLLCAPIKNSQSPSSPDTSYRIITDAHHHQISLYPSLPSTISSTSSTSSSSSSIMPTTLQNTSCVQHDPLSDNRVNSSCDASSDIVDIFEVGKKDSCSHSTEIDAPPESSKVVDSGKRHDVGADTNGNSDRIMDYNHKSGYKEGNVTSLSDEVKKCEKITKPRSSLENAEILNSSEKDHYEFVDSFDITVSAVRSPVATKTISKQFFNINSRQKDKVDSENSFSLNEQKDFSNETRSCHNTIPSNDIVNKENVKSNVEEISSSKQSDPFSLSGDEDFSPKLYKPLKRKLNLKSALSNLAEFGSDKFLSMLDNGDEEIEEDSNPSKVPKQADTDLSPSEKRKYPPVRVAYVYSKELVQKTNSLVRIEGRANLVHSLIAVYGILDHVDVIPPRLATEAEILGFHCPMYISFLKGLTDCDDPSDSISNEAETYGLSYDCPLQDDLFVTASLISGGTIAAAESLVNGTSNIAINWCGGWHHAKKDSASGFCYINDIVLGILKLREKFEKVLYVDLDLHHGDGVEEAFYITPKVMTVSFHKYDCGFFPGTGSLDDIGGGRGRMHTVNVPLLDGIGDAQFYSIFSTVMKKVRAKFDVEAMVIQCGADGLSEDPMASFNLTHVALARCVCFLLTWNLPTLLLGGGGYNFADTARCWTFLTAMAAGKKLPLDIPEHENFSEFGPSYELTTQSGHRRDHNSSQHVDQIISKIHQNLDLL